MSPARIFASNLHWSLIRTSAFEARALLGPDTVEVLVISTNDWSCTVSINIIGKIPKRELVCEVVTCVSINMTTK